MSEECPIIEDLLPLYKKQMLQASTLIYVEQHLAKCPHCQQLFSSVQIQKEYIPMKKTLSFFHIIFIVLSFMFAINSSLLGNQMGFVISYAIFGCLSYLFYKNIWIVFIISSVPVLVWAIIDNLTNELYITAYSLTEFGALVMGASYIALLHTIFALVGAAFAILLRKIFKIKKRLNSN